MVRRGPARHQRWPQPSWSPPASSWGRAWTAIGRVLEIDRDITDKKRVEEELRRAHDELEEKVASRTADLQRANRTLLMVSACDQALVQISDERELIGVICQIIQDEGGYPLVWVGLQDGPRGADAVHRFRGGPRRLPGHRIRAALGGRRRWGAALSAGP